MKEKPKFTKELAQQFSDRLEENEDMMAENAAMAVTLEQFNLEWGDQNDLFQILLFHEGES
jgi:hypothetical protein